jgi:hypothetical protein
MAKPKTVRFGKFLIKLATIAAPTVYVAPCGFTSKSLVLSKNLEEVNIPDCDNPDDPAWIGRDVSSLSATVSGDGILAEESVEVWLDAFNTVEPIPVQIELLLTGTASVTWTGLMHLSNLTVGAEQGGRVTISVEMQSDGEMVGVFSAT